MRSGFLRAVLLGVLAALALTVARRAWAETTVFVCTSASEPSSLRIAWDTERKFALVEDVARSTRDLYPLDDLGSALIVTMMAQLQRDGRYRCRRES